MLSRVAWVVPGMFLLFAVQTVLSWDRLFVYTRQLVAVRRMFSHNTSLLCNTARARGAPRFSQRLSPLLQASCACHRSGCENTLTTLNIPDSQPLCLTKLKIMSKQEADGRSQASRRWPRDCRTRLVVPVAHIHLLVAHCSTDLILGAAPRPPRYTPHEGS